MTSLLLQTIETDLKAGESWLENEAETAGLYLWNALKGAFIALGPTLGKTLTDTLTSAVTAASENDTIEQIETAALTTATEEGKAAIAAAGSGIVQTVIAGIKSNLSPSVTVKTAS
jgi:hypothetical protein